MKKENHSCFQANCYKLLISHRRIYEGGPPQKTEFIYKNCVFILTCFLHLMQFTYRDIFSTAQHSFELLDFDVL